MHARVTQNQHVCECTSQEHEQLQSRPCVTKPPATYMKTSSCSKKCHDKSMVARAFLSLEAYPHTRDFGFGPSPKIEQDAHQRIESSQHVLDWHMPLRSRLTSQEDTLTPCEQDIVTRLLGEQLASAQLALGVRAFLAFFAAGLRKLASNSIPVSSHAVGGSFAGELPVAAGSTELAASPLLRCVACPGEQASATAGEEALLSTTAAISSTSGKAARR